MVEDLFTQALGLSAPWKVIEVKLDQKAQRIDFHVAAHTTTFDCPACGRSGAKRHDGEERQWQHLHFFQYAAFVHAEALRVACSHCGKVSALPVPWARPGSHFTLLFEAFALSLAPVMAVNQAAALLQVNATRLWRVIEHHVARARAQEDFSEVKRIGVDETACKRGQHYITVVHDLDAERLLFATPGSDRKTLETFKTDLVAHGGDANAIKHVSMDMSKAFQAGVREQFPHAQIGFDRFHVVALASTALDQVRREEVRFEPQLKGTRWVWHKHPADFSIEQINQVHTLTRMHLKTARAWRLSMALRRIYTDAHSPEQAAPLLHSWLSWARRCRLEPFKKLAATLKEHLAGVLHGFTEGIHNGRVEAVNRGLQEARARARGYRRVENFIAIAYLIAGKLKHLPKSPFHAAA